MTDDLVREHVLAVLQDAAGWYDAILAERDRLENGGYRLVRGGQVDGEHWEIKDARTGAVLASGGDGMGGYELAAEKLESAQSIFDTSHIWNDVDHPRSAGGDAPVSATAATSSGNQRLEHRKGRPRRDRGLARRGGP